MKNLLKNSLALLAVSSLFLFTSCGDDDTEEPAPNAPTIIVTSELNGSAATSPFDAEPGDEITFDVTISADGGFNVVRVYSSVDGGTSTKVQELNRLDLNLDAGAASASSSFTTTLSAELIGSEVTYEFEAVDDADQVATAEVVVTVNSPEARSYTAKLLAAPLGATADEKTSKTFFSTNTGLVYSMKEVNDSSNPLSADIDFGYFYGSGTGGTAATLADPASYPFAYGQSAWGKRNSTTFRRTDMNAAAFAEVTTFAAIDEKYEAATAADADAGIESGLVAGEVLAFATDATKDGGSKKGLILINSITPGDGENGQISLEILVQEEAQ